MSEFSQQPSSQHESAQRPTRRILVTLSTSQQSQSALDIAAKLAAEMQLELQAMFVEDVKLLRLASLPFTQEIGYTASVVRSLDQASMLQVLEAAAANARRLLEKAARETRFRWSFEVTRGPFAQITCTAAREAEMLVLPCEGGWSFPSPLGRARPAAKPVLVLYDFSPESQHVIETAAQLARKNGGWLLIAPAKSGLARSDEMDRKLRQSPTLQDMRLEMLAESPADNAALVELVRRAKPKALIVNTLALLEDDVNLQFLMKEVVCPIIFMR